MGAERIGGALVKQQCLHLASERLNQVVDVVTARSLHVVHQPSLSEHLRATVSVDVRGHRHRSIKQLLLEIARSGQLHAVGPNEQCQHGEEDGEREDETVREPHQDIDGDERVTAMIESLQRRRRVRPITLHLFTARVYARSPRFLRRRPRGLYIHVQNQTHEEETTDADESDGEYNPGRLWKSPASRRRCRHGNVLLLEAHVGQVDVVGSPRVLEVDVERLVGVLTPVGDTERNVELGRAQDEEVVTEYLVQVQTVVDGDAEERRAAGHVTCKHRLYAWQMMYDLEVHATNVRSKLQIVAALLINFLLVLLLLSYYNDNPQSAYMFICV